jgi:hypothetical protein
MSPITTRFRSAIRQPKRVYRAQFERRRLGGGVPSADKVEYRVSLYVCPKTEVQRVGGDGSTWGKVFAATVDCLRLVGTGGGQTWTTLAGVLRITCLTEGKLAAIHSSICSYSLTRPGIVSFGIHLSISA